VRVRRAVVQDWHAVRSIRLTALADAPFAFGSTLARELAFDDQEWQRRVREGTWFLAWCGQQPVGIVAGISDTDQPEDRHLAAMWVAADQRGTSVAEELVEAIVGWATLQGAARVTLWVADANARARRFYDRLGFATTGQRQPLPSAPETGEELLQRPLDM
jgi:GNAT superfamily N-acetyltransferase